MNYVIDPPAVTRRSVIGQLLFAFALGLSALIGKFEQRIEYYAGSRS